MSRARFRHRTVDPEIMEECGHWLPWIDDVFFPAVESETGDFRHFPWPGSLMDQPYSSFTVLKLIQGEYKAARLDAKAKQQQHLGG